MNLLIYFGIFLLKIIEDSLATLRLIVVSNGKKLLGAILQFITTIIWVILTGSVLIDFLKDFWKIVAFSFGAFFGSYIGCILEERLALGTNNIIIKIKDVSSLISSLKRRNYEYYQINNNMIMITIARKKTKEVIKLIKNVDNRANIICEKVKYFYQ